MTFRIVLLFSVLVTIALVHTVALEFFLYWKYLWLDIPMHVLGGVACSLFFSVLPFFGIRVHERYNRVWGYFAFTLCIGVMWELFEVVAGISRGEPGFVLDTITDLSMDTVGAFIGFILVKKGL